MTIDKMQLTILSDGTIRTVTDGISAPNHDNAEQFLKNVGRLAGGATTRRPRTDVHHHGHVHQHEDGTIHSH